MSALSRQNSPGSAEKPDVLEPTWGFKQINGVKRPQPCRWGWYTVCQNETRI